MKKRYFSLLVSILLILALTNIYAFAESNPDNGEQLGVLYYGPENIRIVAKRSDIMVFITAKDDNARLLAIQELKSNPNNIVEYCAEMPFELVSADSYDEASDAIPTRSPGTWTITPFTLSSGANTYIMPAGGSYFDVAYNETVDLTYYCSPDRLISVMCETSLPSIFYDPDYYSGTTTSWYPGVSGQYRIYFKNYDASSASITGGTVKIS